MDNNVALTIDYISQQRIRKSRQSRSVVGFAVIVAVWGAIGTVRTDLGEKRATLGDPIFFVCLLGEDPIAPIDADIALICLHSHKRLFGRCHIQFFDLSDHCIN